MGTKLPEGVERYKLSDVMHAWPDGEWVRYSDLAAIIAANRPPAAESVETAIASYGSAQWANGRTPYSMPAQTILERRVALVAAIAADKAAVVDEALQRRSQMDEAVAAGGGILHGAIDHWQQRAEAAEKLVKHLQESEETERKKRAAAEHKLAQFEKEASNMGAALAGYEKDLQAAERERDKAKVEAARNAHMYVAAKDRAAQEAGELNQRLSDLEKAGPEEIRELVAEFEAASEIFGDVSHQHCLKNATDAEVEKTINDQIKASNNLLTAIGAMQERKVSSLRAIKASLVIANETGQIKDTLWHTPYETLFDFIDSAIAALGESNG